MLGPSPAEVEGHAAREIDPTGGCVYSASMRLLARLALVPALALTAPSCSSSRAEAPVPAASARPAAASAPASPGALVADGGGIAVTEAELAGRIAADALMDVRQKEYELRKEALDEILAEKLLEKEAGARGLAREELERREIDERAAKPDAAEVERFYTQNQRRLGGVPREQGMMTVEMALRSRNREARAAEFRRELLKKHKVRVLLEPPRYPVSVPADAPALGPAAAPVTIVEFADYQCPFCHQAQAAVDEVLKRYSGKVRFVHRDFPLDGIHPRATPAARASRCAGQQGKFWEYHRGLLTVMTELSDDDLRGRAQKLGLDMKAFGACLAEPAGDAFIRAALEEGRTLGVTATPTFFVNGRRLVGARGVPDFVELIEEELARAAN